MCDAGGGTVDLISYTVIKLDPIIEVKEAGPGSGALCGSTYLDRRFKEFLQNKLGEQKGWDDEVLQDAIADFETMVRMPPLVLAQRKTQALNGSSGSFPLPTVIIQTKYIVFRFLV